jgi:formylglycine-generating enzyme required for sulfatase activity
MSKYCHECGALLKDTDNVCSECGALSVSEVSSLIVDSDKVKEEKKKLQRIYILLGIGLVLILFLFGFIISKNFQNEKEQTSSDVQVSEEVPFAQKEQSAEKHYHNLSDLINLVYIESGTFMMGSPKPEVGRGTDEVLHQVRLESFYLSEKEITNEQYCFFLNAQKIERSGEFAVWKDGTILLAIHDWGVQYIDGKWQPVRKKEKYPVINITWYGAKAFCDWYGDGGRLPTEAEWEYACRAGTTTPFNTGQNLTTAEANYNGNPLYKGYPKGINLGCTQPVGSYPPNTWGLYDMHGNVWEWCNDWYGNYDLNDIRNPQGPMNGKDKVLRGGRWANGARICRSAFRGNYPPTTYGNYYGFRVAKSID